MPSYLSYIRWRACMQPPVDKKGTQPAHGFASDHGSRCMRLVARSTLAARVVCRLVAAGHHACTVPRTVSLTVESRYSASDASHNLRWILPASSRLSRRQGRDRSSVHAIGQMAARPLSFRADEVVATTCGMSVASAQLFAEDVAGCPTSGCQRKQEGASVKSLCARCPADGHLFQLVGCQCLPLASCSAGGRFSAASTPSSARFTYNPRLPKRTEARNPQLPRVGRLRSVLSLYAAAAHVKQDATRRAKSCCISPQSCWCPSPAAPAKGTARASARIRRSPSSPKSRNGVRPPSTAHRYATCACAPINTARGPSCLGKASERRSYNLTFAVRRDKALSCGGCESRPTSRLKNKSKPYLPLPVKMA